MSYKAREKAKYRSKCWELKNCYFDTLNQFKTLDLLAFSSPNGPIIYLDIINTLYLPLKGPSDEKFKHNSLVQADLQLLD